MYTKRIIFLDISGSSFHLELWDTTVAMLEATLRVNKHLDTYVVAFSSECKLLTPKELDKLKAKKSIGISNSGTRGKAILGFFKPSFIKGAKIIIISDMQFVDYADTKILRQEFLNNKAKKVVLFKVDEDMAEFFHTAKQLEISAREEKVQKEHIPTFPKK